MLTVDHDKSVQVVRHDDRGVDLDVAVVSGKILQFRSSDEPQHREFDVSMHDLPENVGTIVRTDRDEIPAAGTVIPVAEPGWLYAVFVLVEGQGAGPVEIIS